VEEPGPQEGYADPALVKILSGQETEDMATVWWVFGTMSPANAMFRAGDRITDRLAGREQDAWNIEPRAAGVHIDVEGNGMELGRMLSVSISRRASSSLRPRSPAAPVRSAAQSRST
jgi:hypothetical protein